MEPLYNTAHFGDKFFPRLQDCFLKKNNCHYTMIIDNVMKIELSEVSIY